MCGWGGGGKSGGQEEANPSQVRETSSHLTAFELVHQLFLAQTPTETLALSGSRAC